MKKAFPVLFLLLINIHLAKSQTAAIQGKPIAEIFADFHYNLDDSLKTTGFGLNRAQFGYNFLPTGYFSGTIIVNIGVPEDLAAGSVHRRYAYFREASITYAKDKLNMSFGITTTRLFDFQQKFWGKRYIANTYQSINGYGFVADLGVVMDYKFNDVVTADVTIMNGEGYSDLQLDNSLRTSAGVTISPVKPLAIRLYGDISRPHGVLQYTLIGFAGYKNELITIGAEASYKSNLDMLEGHDAWGLSATGSVSLSKKTEIFVRYDYSTSVIAHGDILEWNYNNDGRFAVYGFQYTFNPNFRIAIDYQGTFPTDSGKQVSDAIFLNLHFRF
jgi:hypothetical protein